MIEVIEVSGGSAGPGYVARGGWWGGRDGGILDLGGFGAGGGYGICLWFERFRKMLKPCFPDPPRFC